MSRVNLQRSGSEEAVDDGIADSDVGVYCGGKGDGSDASVSGRGWSDVENSA